MQGIDVKGFDLIGDIHGQAEVLERLLKRLGYRAEDHFFYHPQRIAFFVGDFIDGGAANRRVVEIVRGMVENGCAHAVMGNHEYNAICYHTPDPDRPGEYLRPHTPKNNRQHANTLKEFERDPAGLESMIEWFWSLPLYFDLSTTRVVHACWHNKSYALLEDALNGSRCLTESFLLQSARVGTAEHDAVETMLKGPEFNLPHDLAFKDKDGNERREARICWWLDEADSLDEMVIGPPALYRATAGYPAEPDLLIGYDDEEPPVFFGHYWLRGEPDAQASNVVCLDYSAGKGDKLVAYRWEGGLPLQEENFFWEDVTPHG